MERDPKIFGRNVRAFRVLRGWGIRDLAARSGVSTKTILKIERGEGCTVRIEQKMAVGFAAPLGRLWDPSLLSDEPQRVIRKDTGRWFFAAVEDAELFHQRLVKSQPELAEERLRSDPDEIQDEGERHRLGHAGLARAFIRTTGGGLSAGYFQYNQCEIFARDITPADGLNYTYLCNCVQGGLRMGIRDQVFELGAGDSIVFEGNDEYWIEPLGSLPLPTLMQFICLRVLTLPKS